MSHDEEPKGDEPRLSAEEVAAAIAFLVSGDSDFLTGQVIPIAGGWA